MALFESGNPTLSEKIFRRSLDVTDTGTMTVRGAISKFGLLLFLVIAGAVYTWNLYAQYKLQTMQTLFYVGLFGGFVLGMVITFKPNTAKYLAPVYAILEGLFIGGLSAIVNQMMIEKASGYRGIVPQAVALTLGIALVMFLLYNFRIIKPTQKFKAVIVSAMSGIFIFYLVYFVLSLFHVNIAFMQWGDNSMLGIGINLFVVIIAALSLILDFERIEVGQEMGAPKQMEWYGAFGVLVTIVWHYIQVLKLLTRFAGNKN
ncbi:MAG: Bax inhibitor-1/YccA family protein [Chitinophagaceae bacterium]|jgi:uncharacterized YccA/Bax inhibitor family protein|nr:Bax inhibitor-1/YccA family protein [Chitinophagaceae bacterium]